MSLSTVAFASPLQNYEAGKVEVNVGTTLAPAMATTSNGGTSKSDVKNKTEGGATVGLDTIWPCSTNTTASRSQTMSINMRTQEYNLRYKLDKNVSVYARQMHARFGAKSFLCRGICNT